MTPAERAEARGHLMRGPDDTPSGGGLERWECTRCFCAVLTNAENPDGFGSALERDCWSDAA